MVSMLLSQSVFLGIFYGAFDISAHSLFLAIFDEKAMAKAYVVSGFAGIILTSLYTWLQARVHFKNFATLNLVFVTLLTLILWITLYLNPAKQVIFLVFIMLGPLNILAMLGFWGTTGRLFSLRQGKRLFGLVDAGLLIGIILSSYAIPVLLSINFKSHNILLISTLSILVAASIQIMIGKKFTFTVAGSEKQSENRSDISIFWKDSYIRIIGIFIALSVMTAFFVQYSFMAVTREQYPVEEDMARFLGLFIGSMMIFTLLIKVLAFSYLIRNYGLKTCLAISPVIIAGFTTIAIVTGMLMGYTPASGGFILFFLLLALSRLFSKSLKDSIESPSFKVIYQTVDEKIRYEVQSGIDGTINEISALSSGLILSGLGALMFVRLIHFSWVLFVIIILWVFVAIRLYNEYRKSIRKSLETVSGKIVEHRISAGWINLKNKISGIRLFRAGYFNLINGDLSVIDNSENKHFIRYLLDYAENSHDINMLPSLKKITEKSHIDNDLRQRSSDIIDQLEKMKGDPQKLSKSGSLLPDYEKILYARKIISGSRLPQTTEILRLLRDSSIESKRQAIYMIGKFRLKDMLNEVCNCLSIPELETDATAVLEHFGSEASDELYRCYLSNSGNLNSNKLLLRLIGRSSIKEYSGFIFSRLWSNSRQIKNIAIKCLIENGYKVADEEKDKLHQLISEIIGTITWNISAQTCLANNNDIFLLKEFKKETAAWNTFLFNVLSIAYDPGSLSKIRENLENGTVESVNYALEMIDIVIGDSIKSKLISFVDVVPDEVKLKNLHQFFPGYIPGYDQLKEDIINRDYNLISIWTKACVLRSTTEIPGKDMEESVAALLFSPEKILREEAALLFKKTMKDYYSVYERLPAESKNELDKIISGIIPADEFLFEKIRFLSSLFTGVSEDELLFLAEGTKYVKNLRSPEVSGINDCIIWSLLSDRSDVKVSVLHGSLGQDFAESNVKSEDGFCYIMPYIILEYYQNMFPESALKIFKYLDNYDNCEN